MFKKLFSAFAAGSILLFGATAFAAEDTIKTISDSQVAKGVHEHQGYGQRTSFDDGTGLGTTTEHGSGIRKDSEIASHMTRMSGMGERSGSTHMGAGMASHMGGR